MPRTGCWVVAQSGWRGWSGCSGLKETLETRTTWTRCQEVWRGVCKHRSHTFNVPVSIFLPPAVCFYCSSRLFLSYPTPAALHSFYLHFCFIFLMSCNFFFYLQALCVRTQTINGKICECECVSEVWKTLLICKWLSFPPSFHLARLSVCLSVSQSLSSSSCSGQGQVTRTCDYQSNYIPTFQLTGWPAEKSGFQLFWNRWDFTMAN